jgi:hypothetical protein
MIRDKNIQRALLQDGYVIVGSLDAKALDALDRYHEQTQISEGHFYYSLLNNSSEQNKEIARIHKDILSDFFESHFSDYRTITESYLGKPAKTEAELLLHQDWCYTDEQNYQAYNVWIPLSDVTVANGALFFLKGSHLWFDNKRSGSLHTTRISSGQSIISQHLVTIPMRKGDVLLFHPAVLHGSHPNRSSQHRIAVTATIMDREAPFLYYHPADGHTVESLQLGDDRFVSDLSTLTQGLRPDAPVWDRSSYYHYILTEDMICAKLTS